MTHAWTKRDGVTECVWCALRPHWAGASDPCTGVAGETRREWMAKKARYVARVAAGAETPALPPHRKAGRERIVPDDDRHAARLERDREHKRAMREAYIAEHGREAWLELQRARVARMRERRAQ